MRFRRHLLFPLACLALFTGSGVAEVDEPALPESQSYWMGVPVAREDDDPPATLPLAKFKEAVAKVQVAGFHRMPEMSEGGDHQLILVGPSERAFYIMAQRASIGAKYEKGAAGKLSRFLHNGHEAFFAQLKDEEGTETAFIIVKYPEYNMALFVSAKPRVRRAELLKLLAQVEL